MELAVEDFSGGELEELVLSWLEIIELVITFFCCKKPKTITVQCCGSITFWGGSGSGSADPCL
jgi:hypothetical protein